MCATSLLAMALVAWLEESAVTAAQPGQSAE